MKTAMYYENKNGVVQCHLCPHSCIIPFGQRGFCIARANRNGKLVAESFGRLTSISLDPIEKKPFRHFHPGRMILSLGSYGCNFRCDFCQNHEISMREAHWRIITPEEVATLSHRYVPQGNIGVAFTYNEPLIGYEFVRECAFLIHRQGQQNVLVSNGYINPEPLMALLPFIDAMNIDLKAFTPQFYKKVDGELEIVKAAIAIAAQTCHIEITTMVIPGINDSADEMESLAEWLSSINKAIPLHIARFYPRYKMSSTTPTSLSILRSLANIAAKHLLYVYLGNC